MAGKPRDHLLRMQSELRLIVGEPKRRQMHKDGRADLGMQAVVVCKLTQKEACVCGSDDLHGLVPASECAS